MAAPAGPPPPNFIPQIPRILDLHGLDAFQPAIPQSLPNLPAPIQNVENHDGYQRVRVRDSAILEKCGCGCGGTRQLKNYLKYFYLYF